MEKINNIHFISIGGSIMHNLAIALHLKGMQVTGSDDEINEPSLSRLAKYDLLPAQFGWFPDKIHEATDAVILGMHAKADNPELIKARSLGIPVYSFPDFIREQSAHKQRIVIAGSHGKTTITAIIIHILHYFNKPADYLVGAALAGIEHSVKLSDAPIIIIEGDEYLTSPLDPEPKFLKYDHHMALISGIEWDHMNVFPNFEDYVKQFDLLADKTPKAGTIIFCEEDNLVTVIGSKERVDVKAIEYKSLPHKIINGVTYLISPEGKNVPVQLFGKHNVQNISGAFALLQRIGITEAQCYESISSFAGAAKRLQLIGENIQVRIFQDFAHAPSKVSATCKAVKKQFAENQLIGVLELHTFSSLNKEFLPQYAQAMSFVDVPLVYISPKTLQHKNLPEISESELQHFFKNPKIKLLTESDHIRQEIFENLKEKTTVLLMSSGTFGGLDLSSLVKNILEKVA